MYANKIGTPLLTAFILSQSRPFRLPLSAIGFWPVRVHRIIMPVYTFTPSKHGTIMTIRVLLMVFLSAMVHKALAQRTYFTNQGEYIFSGSPYKGGVAGVGQARTRFTLFPNSEFIFNADSRGMLGLATGLTLRNVGFVYRDSELHKRRSLSMGVPIHIKLGDLENDNFFMLGAEIESFFHYKRKDWNNGEKIKYSEWLSDELNIVQPSIMAGFCHRHILVRAKYYFFDFFNQDYVDAKGNKPYHGFRSNIFYISLAIRQFMNFGNDNEALPDNGGDTQNEEAGYPGSSYLLDRLCHRS